MNQLTTTSSRVRSVAKHAATVAVGCAALALLATNASAGQEPDTYVPRQRVDFQDLDLSKQSDAKRLYRRLKLAASEVCVGYPEARGSLRHTARGRCEHAAITNAVETIGNPNLTALHAHKSDVKLAQGKSKQVPNS